MTARNSKWRRYEQESVRNMPIELDWLNKVVNNILIERNWLNVLVGGGGGKQSYAVRTDQV